LDRRLRIILELVSSNLASGIRGAGSLFSGFANGIVNGVKSAGAALMSLAQTAFFVREALNTLAQAGRWVFDVFIKGAADTAKLEAKLRNIAGSSEDAGRIIDLLNQTAADTGASFDELAAGAGLMAVAAKDASGAFDFDKFARLMDMLQRMAALRPDVPLDRLARGLSTAATTGNWQSLELFLDVPLRQLVDIADAADEVAKTPEQIGRGVTFIETKTSEAAQDALKSLDLLDEALKKAGATAGIVGDVAELSGLERFQQILQQIAKTIGEPIFEVLNRELSELADWLTENPDKVEAFAESIGQFLADNLEKAVAALEKFNWEKLADDLVKLAQALADADWQEVLSTMESVAKAAKTIADAIGLAIEGIEAFRAWKAEHEATGVLGGGLETPAGAATPASRLMGGGVMGGGLENRLKLEVHVTSDNEMFRAHVKQVADGAVTEGLNELNSELENAQ
jgi:hypothetical protein